MATLKRCPQCGSVDLKSVGGRLLRCAMCEQELVYETPWLAVVLTWVLTSAVLGGDGFALVKRFLRWDSPAIWLMIIFPVIAVTSYLRSRRLATLRKKSP